MAGPIYVFLLFFISAYELLRRKEAKFDFLSLFNIGFFCFYALTGLLLWYDFNTFAGFEVSLSAMNYDVTGAATALCAAAAYFTVLLGFHASSARGLGRMIVIAPQGESILGLAGALLAIGAFATLLHALAYGHGDIVEAFFTVRRGTQPDPTYGFAYMSKFIPCSTLAVFLVVSEALHRPERTRKWVLGSFAVLAIMVSIGGLALLGARLPIIRLLLLLYLLYVLHTNSFHTRTLLLPIATGVTIIIAFGVSVFDAIASIEDGLDAAFEILADAWENADIISVVVSAFGHFQLNMASIPAALSAATTDSHRFTAFTDVPIGFLAVWVPQRLVGFDWPHSISWYNTGLIIGDYERSFIPPGFVGYSLYSLWVPGLLIASFIYGWLGRFLQTVILNGPGASPLGRVLFVTIGFTWAYYLQIGDPQSFFLDAASLTLLLAYLLLFGSRLRWRSPTPKLALFP